MKHRDLRYTAKQLSDSIFVDHAATIVREPCSQLLFRRIVFACVCMSAIVCVFVSTSSLACSTNFTSCSML